MPSARPHPMPRVVLVLLVVLVSAAALLTAPPPPPAAARQVQPQQDESCPAPADLVVPGAEFSEARCLPDLTTLSNPFRTTGGGTRDTPVLHSAATVFPDAPVPGVQIDGWLPDSCDRYEPEMTTYMPSCTGGFRHNGQFTIRIPADWDGVHLVVAGAPGVRDQHAQDPIISDWVLHRGWAYAAHDKGATGLSFFRAGDDETGGSLTSWLPNASIQQWSRFMRDVALAAEGVLAGGWGRAPTRTFAAGASNGGHQVRLALERHPDVFDGGVDWEGTLIEPSDTNMFATIPALLREYPAVRAGDRGKAYRRFVHDGFIPPGSAPVWDQHWITYWSPVASAYRPAVDPEYLDGLAVTRTPVLPADPDAQYDWASRPQAIKDRLAADIGNTGDIHGRPLITLHGTLDALLPIETHSDRYADMVRGTGHADTFRYWVVEGGTHVDAQVDATPEVFRPLLPCFLEALDALDAWVGEGTAPPPSGFVPFPADTTPAERANGCAPPDRIQRVAGPDRITTAIAGSRGAHTIAEQVVLASGDGGPDALVAGPLAVALDAPLLLVGDRLTQDLRAELARLGAAEAVVVGGAAAVPEEVLVDLADLGLDVRRLAGEDRYATAAVVAQEVGAPAGHAVIAAGGGTADALVAGPLAVTAGGPLLLVRADDVPAATAGALAALGVTRTTVVGGPAVVGDAPLAALPAPVRVAGHDRLATALAVAEAVLTADPDARHVAVAAADRAADALAAGAVIGVGYGGGAAGGPLVLVDGRDQAGADGLVELLSQHRDRLESVIAFGGTAVLADEVLVRVGGALADGA